MMHQELTTDIDWRAIIWDIAKAAVLSAQTKEEEKVYEEDMAICQNPQCNDAFFPDPDDVEALLCPRCADLLPAIEVDNIRYAIHHGLHPEVYGAR